MGAQVGVQGHNQWWQYDINQDLLTTSSPVFSKVNVIGTDIVQIGSLVPGYANVSVKAVRYTADWHAFEDWSVLALGDLNVGYCSYDAFPTFNNSLNESHLVGFQFRGHHHNDGAHLGAVYGFWSFPRFDAVVGIVDIVKHLFIQNPLGIGVININYGIYIEPQTRGIINYNVYSLGGQNYYSGLSGFHALVPRFPIEVGSLVASGTPSTTTLAITTGEHWGSTVNPKNLDIDFWGAVGVTQPLARIRVVDEVLDIAGGYFSFWTNIDFLNLVEIMRITRDGKVGINKTVPNSKLAVVGLISYATDALAGVAGLTTGDFYTETGTNPLRVCQKI